MTLKQHLSRVTNFVIALTCCLNYIVQLLRLQRPQSHRSCVPGAASSGRTTPVSSSKRWMATPYAVIATPICVTVPGPHDRRHSSSPCRCCWLLSGGSGEAARNTSHVYDWLFCGHGSIVDYNCQTNLL